MVSRDAAADVPAGVAGRAGRAGPRPRTVLVGLATLGVAGTAAVLAAHVDLRPDGLIQPIWPFPLRPDGAALADPVARRELWRLAPYAVLAVAAFVALRSRWARVAGPLAMLALAMLLPVPNFRALMVEAYPTSYYRSETDFDVGAILAGERFLREHCNEACFRDDDDPADLSRYGIWGRRDGDFYGWLETVFDRIGHSPFPHGTIATLDPTLRWQLIDYFRAAAAGRAVTTSGAWRVPVRAPDFALACNGRPGKLSDFAGRPVRIAFIDSAGPPAASPAVGVPVVDVFVGTDPRPLPAGACRAVDPAIAAAYALVVGIPTDEIGGDEILVDADGRLRRRWPGSLSPARPETADLWRDLVERAAGPGPLRPLATADRKPAIRSARAPAVRRPARSRVGGSRTGRAACPARSPSGTGRDRAGSGPRPRRSRRDRPGSGAA